MNRIPHIALILAAVLLLAADDKAKEPIPSAAQIQKWVKQLGDEDFKVREEATRDLIKAGEAALDAVTKATESKDPEVKQRALMIIQQIEKTAIAYFKKLGRKVTVYEERPGKPVKQLTLNATDITDAGLVHLKGLTNLQHLHLQNTQVADAGLVHLKGLTNLSTLGLEHTKISDAGLVHLKGLTSLKSLLLDKTKITDAGLVHLKELSKLTSLDFQDTKVTDAGLVHLKGLSKLTSLDFQDTKVTDAGLVHLKGLANLQRLNLYGTKVSNSGIEKLKKALPGCNIRWDDPDGKITSVNQALKTVYINFGYADGLKRRVSFRVIPNNGQQISEAPIKGQIEVTRVTGAHQAEARILKSKYRNIRNPILKNDRIFSNLWTPGKRDGYALAGFIDIDGDGRNDRAKVKSLLMQNSGSIDAVLDDDGNIHGKIKASTKYLIIGAYPNNGPEKLKNAYDIFAKQAEDLGVRTIPLIKILDDLGYKGRRKVDKSSSQFRKRAPTRKNAY